MSRRNRHRLGFCYRLLVVVFKSLMLLLARCDRRGMENIPRDGGFIAVVNHVSYLDGPAYLLAQHDAGRPPRFMGKAEVLEVPFLGRMLRGTGRLIPVYRETGDAALAYREALVAVQRGSALVVFPEGTLTRDPGLWPMTGKSGAARIALATGVPVVPVALWGTHEVLPPYAKRLRLFPRKTVRVLVGPPVDLSAFEGAQPTGAVLREATEVIMGDMTRLLEQLRGETAPAERFDPRAHGTALTGNPYQRAA